MKYGLRRYYREARQALRLWWWLRTGGKEKDIQRYAGEMLTDPPTEEWQVMYGLKDGTYVLFFLGNNGALEYATSSDGIAWLRPKEPQPSRGILARIAG